MVTPRSVRCLFVLAVVALCLLASSGAVASGGSRSSTRTVVSTVHNFLGHQDGGGDGDGAEVGEGRRVRAGQLPRTGRNTAQWIALAVASLLLGAGFVAAAIPRRRLGWISAPVREGLVRAASCGYALEDGIFDVDRPRP